MRQIKQVTLLLVLLLQVLVLRAGSGPFETRTGPKGEAKVLPESVSTNGGPVLSVLPANDLTEDVVAAQEADGLSVSMEEGPLDAPCDGDLGDLTDDLGSNPELDEFLKNTPGGGKAWEKLWKKDNSVSEKLRKNKTVLEWFAKNGDDIPKSVANELLESLEGRQIAEVIEDAQQRLVIVTQSTGPSGATTVVATVEKTANGSYKTFKYSQAYSKASPPVSANKLAPDFSSNPNGEWLYPITGNQKNIVRIKLTGKRSGSNGDFAKSNEAANLPGQDAPPGYVWHHLDDFDPETEEATFQLVKIVEHNKTKPHTGSFKQYENYKSTQYED